MVLLRTQVLVVVVPSVVGFVASFWVWVLRGVVGAGAAHVTDVCQAVARPWCPPWCPLVLVVGIVGIVGIVGGAHRACRCFRVVDIVVQVDVPVRVVLRRVLRVLLVLRQHVLHVFILHVRVRSGHHAGHRGLLVVSLCWRVDLCFAIAAAAPGLRSALVFVAGLCGRGLRVPTFTCSGRSAAAGLFFASQRQARLPFFLVDELRLEVLEQDDLVAVEWVVTGHILDQQIKEQGLTC